ncbi:MAG: GNAT family N-acetyltransferase [Desulfobacter sp.]|nr:MAG: GNAT family N-acetyltransferase [Desulfobacter sp.]
MIMIETKRLVIQKLSVSDAPFILALLNDQGWLRYIGDKGVRTLEDARSYILNGPMQSYEEFGFGLFLVKLKEADSSIGICGLLKRDYLAHVDLGFALLSEYRGKGYAAESAAAVLGHGKKQFGFRHVSAIAQPDNLRSIKVLKKIGFKQERLIEPPGTGSQLALFGKDV